MLAVSALLGVGLVLLRPAPVQATHSGARLEVYREIGTGIIPTPASPVSVKFVARIVNDIGGPLDYDNAAPLKVDWEVEGGSGDAEGGAVTRHLPDVDDCQPLLPANQTINGRGIGFPECVATFTSSTAGTGIVRAWIDVDGFDNSSENISFRIEADPDEGRYAGEGDCDTEMPPPPDGNGATNDEVPDPADDESTFNECAAATEQPGAEELDGTDVVQLAFTSQSLETRLDCPPATPAPRSGTGLVNCRVTDTAGNPRPGIRVDGQHLGGPNDPDTGEPDNIADYNGNDDPECTSSASGVCVVDIPSNSGEEGTTEVCFWLDEDTDVHEPVTSNPSWGPDIAMVESVADGSQCDEEPAANLADDANAKTDRETLVWQNAVLSLLDVTPETNRSTLPGSHALDAVITDQFGRGWAGGDQIRFELLAGSASDQDGSTLSSPDLACSPATSGDTVGSCSVSYDGRAVGSDQLCAFVAGQAVNSTCNGETPSGNQGGGLVDAVTMQWVQVDPIQQVDQGYTLVGGDGGIFNFGSSVFKGSMGGQKLNAPVITMAHTPGGGGYWLVASDGGVFTFGDAVFFGSMGAQKLNAPVIGMEATPTGKGYWLYASDGGIFTFGDAVFFGSMGAQKLNAPVVGMSASTSGKGYWLVAQDGGVFTFGDARFFGSTGDKKLNEPVFDLAPGPGDNGYWLVARDGGIFTFGTGNDFYGSGVGKTAGRVIGMDPTPNRKGYWIADAAGKVLPFGDAKWFGDRAGQQQNAAIVGFATVPSKR